MKSDIPRLMRERNLDALIIDGPDGLDAANSPFTYFIGDVHIATGRIIITREATTLVHGTMERDEAAKTGLNLIDNGRYNILGLMRKHNGDRLAAQLDLIRAQFADLGVAGRVAFYGANHQNSTWALLNAIAREELCEVVGEYDDDIITKARETKDAREVAEIRKACAATETVIGETRDFLRRHAIKGGVLVQPSGDPLRIADVKRFMRLSMVSAGLEASDAIFAIGRDAGVPHSAGTPTDLLETGKSIVFDIFPRLPGGYYADITRTWCIGHAPAWIEEGYAQVMEVHRTVAAMFDSTRPASTYQEKACDIFEKYGHATLRKGGAGISSGYIHSLGHGFGLSVHEAPGMRNAGLGGDKPLPAGTVITNEPGLYYPDDARGGWGVRVEDDYWLNPETGRVECLTEFDRSLLI
ncbi:MAG: M24 family metallopeptidase [Thermoflexales bacterium]|nr:M24 family metallopeptidase [Thermoflexales bacterium]